MLNNRYLSELEAQKTSVAVTISSGAGTVTFSTMAIDPLRGKDGIIAVNYTPGSGTYSGVTTWATRIEFRDIKRTTNTYLAASDTNPLYYILSEGITFLATTTGVAEVFYLGVPTDIASDVDLSLNSALDNLVLTHTEAMCWKMVGDYNRMNGLLETVKLEADILNARYQIPSKYGI
jgi:hypothetical protein